MAYIAENQIIGARAGGTVSAGAVAAQGAHDGGYVTGGTVGAGGFAVEAHAPFLGAVTVQIVGATTPATGQRWPR